MGIRMRLTLNMGPNKFEKGNMSDHPNYVLGSQP